MKLPKIIVSSLFLLFNSITSIVGQVTVAGVVADFLVTTIAGLATNYLWYEIDKKFGLSEEEGGNKNGGVVISVKRDEQIDAGISLINGFLIMILEKIYARDYEMEYIVGMGSRLTFRLPLKSMKFPRVCPYELSHKPECKE